MAYVAGRFVLPIGIVIRVQEAESFRYALLQVALCTLEPIGTPNVVTPYVQGRVPVVHPFRTDFSDATGSLDTHRVQSTGDVEVLELRRLAHMKLVIRCKTFGATEKTAPANVLKHRNADHGLFQHRHELLFHVPRQFVETEILGDFAHG